MKSDKLNIYIRKIVREEVAMAINEVITEMTKPSQLNLSQPKKPNKKRVVEKQIYSTNSVLNDVLNETAQTAVLEEGDNPITKMNSVMQASYGDMMNDTSNVPAEDTSGMGQFLNKDYSKVLKKSYEKSRKR
jgi:phage/plasmid primase-like uncharacterized protein